MASFSSIVIIINFIFILLRAFGTMIITMDEVWSGGGGGMPGRMLPESPPPDNGGGSFVHVPIPMMRL